MPRKILLYAVVAHLCFVSSNLRAAEWSLVEQTEVAASDSADWKRYFPIAIGNVWEYEVAEGPPLWRREIVADTVVGDWKYFVMSEVNPAHPSRETFFARYDNAGFIVILADINADTVPAPRRGWGYGQFADFDLRASPGDTLPYYRGEPPSDYYWVEQRSDDELDDVKCFMLEYWEECYALDVGFTGGGSLQRSHLTYAKIGDREFGTRRHTSTGHDPGDPEGFGIHSVFPNPARDHATVIYSSDAPGEIDLILYNLLGQVMMRERVHRRSPATQRHMLSLVDHTPGVYILRLTNLSGNAAFVPVVIHR